MERGSHLPTAARARTMEPEASAKGHRAGCGPSGTPRRRGRPYRPLPSMARCHRPLHLRLQPMTRPGQWPPEPPWPSGQRTGRCMDGGEQADKRAIIVQAAGRWRRGGPAGHDLSVRSTLATARPGHAWAAPTLNPASQSLAGQAGRGGGVPWHEAHLGRRPPPHTRTWPYKAGLVSVRPLGGSGGGGGVRSRRGLVDRARTILSGQHAQRAGLAAGPA